MIAPTPWSDLPNIMDLFRQHSSTNFGPFEARSIHQARKIGKALLDCSDQFSTSLEIMKCVLLPKGTLSSQRLLHQVQHGHMRKLSRFYPEATFSPSHSPILSTTLESFHTPEAPPSETNHKNCRFYAGYSLATRSP